MKALKRICKKLQAKSGRAWNNIDRNPMEAIEFIVSVVMLLIGIYSMIPSQWLGISTAYGNDIVKLIVGVLISYYPAKLAWWKMSRPIDDYTYALRPKRRKALLVTGSIYIYFTFLRILLIGAIPPLWLLYCGLGLVAFVCYVRLSK